MENLPVISGPFYHGIPDPKVAFIGIAIIPIKEA